MTRDRSKPRVEDVLAENYAALRELAKERGLWKGPGVSPKTANNVENARHNTKLQTIINMAGALGVEPFQLLMPVKNAKLLAVLTAWAQTDDDGRDNLEAIAEAMLRRRKDNASQPNPAVAQRKRDRTG